MILLRNLQLLTLKISGTFTIPATGTYLITFEMTFDSAGATLGIFNQMWIAKNFPYSVIRFGQQKSQVTGDVMFITSSCQMRLITNDVIELYVIKIPVSICIAALYITG